ncbi:MAG TPA: UDP-2,3-diacylglucosamine diphosphatase [Alcaligenes sp.]|nr:UDP-2,3-diacylglucosamine diphosphatase [Alcaligenes sp.]
MKTSSSKKPLSLNKQVLPGIVWIAADLHLGPDNPATIQDFRAFLDKAQAHADALILCGDIFNAWIGDDQTARPAAWLNEVSQALRQYGEHRRLYLMRGNRDFLLGQAYARHVHATLLPDQILLDTSAGCILLSHGDEYCLDDPAYQRFRRWVRKPWLQALYLACPLSLRQRIADTARARSRQGNRYKADSIMDVSPSAIEHAAATHSIVALVHGHTHRPARHAIAGQPDTQRWVLPDWDHPNSHAARGGYISIDGTRVCLHQWGQADLCQTMTTASEQPA